MWARVTKYVVVESFDITPADLAIRAYEISKGVMIKETCFGLVISGKEEEVDRIVAELRKIDPDHIFVKDRGFPPGDSRRCRANLGGARPGISRHGVRDDRHPVCLARA
jgi:putative methanogenesis marker protein 6